MIWCESILYTVKYKDITAYLSCPLKFYQFEIHRYVCLILNMERKLLQFMFRKVKIMMRHALLFLNTGDEHTVKTVLFKSVYLYRDSLKFLSR